MFDITATTMPRSGKVMNDTTVPVAGPVLWPIASVREPASETV
jgi:hypothetical protein